MRGGICSPRFLKTTEHEDANETNSDSGSSLALCVHSSGTASTKAVHRHVHGEPDKAGELDRVHGGGCRQQRNGKGKSLYHRLEKGRSLRRNTCRRYVERHKRNLPAFLAQGYHGR